MAETLEHWIGRQLSAVDEDGSSCRAIRMTAGDGGATWDLWESPLRLEEGGPGPQGLAQLIEGVIDQLSEEWPARKKHQIMLLAEGRGGLERARYLLSRLGKSTSASGAQLTSEGVHQAQAMQLHVATMQTLLGASQSQVQILRQSYENAMEANQILMGLNTQRQLREAVEGPIVSNPELDQVKIQLFQKLVEEGPGVLHMALSLLQKKAQ